MKSHSVTGTSCVSVAASVTSNGVVAASQALTTAARQDRPHTRHSAAKTAGVAALNRRLVAK